MIHRCLRCGGGARHPVCAKCRRIVGAIESPQELALVETENQFIEDAVTRRHLAPAIASFFIPGMGQIMKLRVLTAIGIWLLMLICVALFFLGGLYFMAAIWLAQVGDAYKSPDYGTRSKLLAIGRRRGWKI